MKKALLVTSLAALCLALMGTAYAAWSDALDVAGVIRTGTLNVTLTRASSNDAGANIDPGQTKHVASTEVLLSEKSATVTIENGYPGYMSQTSYEITNTGTIPAKVTVKATPSEDFRGKVILAISGRVFTLLPGDKRTLTVESTLTGEVPEDSRCGYTLIIDVAQHYR